MSVKDRYAIRPLVMLDACLTLSWPDMSFRPWSLWVNSGWIPGSIWVCNLVGSKYVCGVNGVRPRCQVRVLTLADCYPLGCGTDPTHELVLSCAKGDLWLLLQSMLGCVLGIPLQLDRNRFESPSLPDSENLTWAAATYNSLNELNGYDENDDGYVIIRIWLLLWCLNTHVCLEQVLI